MSKPKILKDLNIEEVSLVDVPANPGAHAVLFKRGEVADIDKMIGGEMTMGELEEKIEHAIKAAYDKPDQRTHLEDFTTTQIVFELCDALGREAYYMQSYSMTDGEVMLEGEPQRVEEETDYVPAQSTGMSFMKRMAQRLGLSKQAPMKTDGGTQYPASDYAYVPDPEKPSTWKLRLTSSPGGTPDIRIVGAALAALGPGGFRGQRVQIPAADMPGVKRKVRAAWLKAHPDKTAADLPTLLKRGDDMADNIDDLTKRLDELESENAELKTQLADKVGKADAVAKFREELPEGVRKAFDGLDEAGKGSFMAEYGKTTQNSPMAKMLEDMTKRADEDRAELAKMKAKSDREDLVKGELAVLAKCGNVDELAGAVIKLRAHDAEAVDLLVKQLTTLAVQAETGGLFKSLGKDGEGFGSEEKLEKMAQERAKADGTSFEVAYAKVLDENPSMYEDMSKEA